MDRDSFTVYIKIKNIYVDTVDDVEKRFSHQTMKLIDRYKKGYVKK